MSSFTAFFIELCLECVVDSNTGKGCSQRLVACLSTLHLFSKIKPDLMVKHATTLQPYLDIKCSVSLTHRTISSHIYSHTLFAGCEICLELSFMNRDINVVVTALFRLNEVSKTECFLLAKLIVPLHVYLGLTDSG